jgi:hypothetical protein
VNNALLPLQRTHSSDMSDMSGCFHTGAQSLQLTCCRRLLDRRKRIPKGICCCCCCCCAGWPPSVRGGSSQQVIQVQGAALQGGGWDKQSAGTGTTN